MIDEEQIQKFLPSPEQPVELHKEKIIVNGKERPVVRNNRGMFAKKAALTKQQITESTLALLTDDEDSPDGKSPYQKAVENVASNAALSCEQPVFDKLGNLIVVDGKPLTVKDPKLAMASAKSLDSIAKIAGLPAKKKRKMLVLQSSMSLSPKKCWT